MFSNSSAVLSSHSLKLCSVKVHSHLFTSRFFTQSTCYPQIKNEVDGISNLTDYVNRQMFLLKPTAPKEKAETINMLLHDCQSADDVLELIGNMHRLNKLWVNELPHYYQRLVDVASSIVNVNDAECIMQSILNHENFHLLLKKTCLSLTLMKSHDLVLCFVFYAKLQTPVDSFVISHIVEVIQRRINDFFPKDVAICHYALKQYGFGTQQMKALEKGLMMHLENISKDENFFIRTATESGLETIFYLVENYANTASSELKRCLSNSIGRSIRLQQGSEPNFDSDFAIRLLSILSQLKYHNKPLIYKSLAVLDTDNLSSSQKKIVELSCRTLGVTFNEDQLELASHMPNHLLSE